MLLLLVQPGILLQVMLGYQHKGLLLRDVQCPLCVGAAAYICATCSGVVTCASQHRASDKRGCLCIICKAHCELLVAAVRATLLGINTPASCTPWATNARLYQAVFPILTCCWLLVRAISTGIKISMATLQRRCNISACYFCVQLFPGSTLVQVVFA